MAEEKAKGRSTLSFEMTDVGNARRLIHRHGNEIRYVGKWHTWLAWDRQRWAPESRGRVRALAINTVEHIGAEIALLSKATDGLVDKKLKPIQAFARMSQSVGRINAMVDLAQALPDVLVEPDKLDADPYLFNVQNGTLDLRQGKLLQHNREHLITKLAPVVFDRTVKCPNWIRFINDIFEPHPELINYIQKLLGYSMTGDMREAVLPIFYGNGRNGKTTLLERILHFMGDYGSQTGIQTFAAKRDGSIPNDLAALAGKRFVVTSEANKDTRLNESLIKQMTGGTTLNARFMRQEWFAFQPMFKCFIDTNHLPKARMDDALAARLSIIPFDVSFVGKEDRDLPRKLEMEASGILNWMLEGCQKFLKEGLGRPPILASTLLDYERSLNPIVEFIETECEKDETFTVAAQQLYDAYYRWCGIRKDYYLTMTVFSERIVKVPGIKKRIMKAKVGDRLREVTVYDGISLLTNQPAPRKIFPIPGGVS